MGRIPLTMDLKNELLKFSILWLSGIWYFLEILQSYILNTLLQSSSNAVSVIQKLGGGGPPPLIVAFPLQYHPYFLEILQSYILNTLLQSSSNAVSVQSSSNAVSVIQKLGGGGHLL